MSSRWAERGRDVAAAASEMVWFCLVLVLAASPFWLGGNRLICWGLVSVAMGGLVLLQALPRLLGTAEWPLPPRAVAAPAIFFILFIGVACVQLLPLPGADPLRASAAEALGQPLPSMISLSPDLTGLAVLRAVSAAAVFWIAVQLGRSETLALRLLTAIAAIAFAYAAYGIIAHTLSPATLLWFEKTAYRDSVTSTFVNRNSFATYAGLGLLAAVAVATAAFRRAARGQSGWQRRLAAMIEASPGRAGLAVGAALVLIIALMMSGSRAGIACSLAALLVFVSACFMRRRSRTSWGLLVLIGGAAAIMLVAWVYGDTVAGRFEDVGDDAGRRLDVYAAVLRAIALNPMGTGFGAFADTFPTYRDTAIPVRFAWDKAHNSPLEAVFGLGVIGAAPAFALFLSILWRTMRGVTVRRRNIFAPAVGVAACLLVGLHSLVDFSLQVQAVTLVFAAMAGVAYAQSYGSRDFAPLHAEPVRIRRGR
ncbi:O-antigen ligase family protein [Terrihabitans rhizophilus]|uniref:O-antigen ligase family protein n=1 Tax=Terrihabitans rhizophilus TaxID=3092662 RepID=A0ABU4RSL9_9HYPH|nr:O-antigen ligase family protein [Terrihabitans sp. PJ23]MDX6805756.1 O-antigen ligase family protein [Terrihabitans sp. PJ23]